MAQLLVRLRNALIYLKWHFLSNLTSRHYNIKADSDFVVSIASYPKRAHLLPAVFEALDKQTKLPLKWLLVLSEEEWPNLNLPKYLIKMQKRGLEILWVKGNTFAVKKLLPVMEKYPNLAVITLDDDIIYHKSLLKGLIDQSYSTPKAIIGYVGKSLIQINNKVEMFYRDKKPANIGTPSSQVYLIGWGGILYPANSLSKLAFDSDAINLIVPGRGSDIWFWAAAIANNTPQICLGLPSKFNLGIPIPQNQKTQPKDLPSSEIIKSRFQMAVDYFAIRQYLEMNLPESKSSQLE